jgi:tetratricopeptide (TPR) repeat protein
MALVNLRALTAASLVCLICCRGPALPELPDLRLDAFQPSVKAEVEKALGALQIAPRDAAANGRLGMVLQAHDQYAAARTLYERARILDKKAFEWPYYLSVVEGSLGNYEAALRALEAATSLRPDYLPARLKRADILFDLGRLDESRKLYEELVKQDAGLAAGWYGAGRVLAALGETGNAIESLSKACELFPQYGSAHYALAQAFRKMGKEAQAQQHLKMYEANKTALPPAGDPYMAELSRLNRGAAYLLRLARDAEEQGKMDEALQFSLRALSADEKSVQAHTNLISIYGRMGQAEKAAEHYRQAIALNQNQADAHYNYGVLLFAQKRFAEAKKPFEKAISINPQYAEAHNNLGYLLEMEGNAALAIRHYQEAIASRPDYRLAHFHLGRIMTSQRRYEEAIAHFEKTLTPEDASTAGYLYALGAALGRSGQRARSIEVMQKAREKAAGLGQRQLVASIEKDLKILERK